MQDLPPLRISFFPTMLVSQDIAHPIPVETLSDEQARTFWRSQEEAFIKHVQKRRKGPAMGTPKRWAR